jgi:isopenicillin-N N-acyltransferase-like protein
MDSRDFSVPPKPDPGPGSAGGLRLLRVEGDGAARGNAHGEEFRELVADAMGRWREALALREDMAPKEYIEDFLSSTGFAASAKELSPDLFAEVEGIAAGSGQPFRRCSCVQPDG